MWIDNKTLEALRLTVKGLSKPLVKKKVKNIK